jgi:hypothetical protein
VTALVLQWALALAVGASPPALRGGELTARISYETFAVGSDGVTRETRYQELVSRADRLLVDVGPEDYARVDVSGKWEDAWYLLAPAAREALRPSGRASAVAGARWLERRAGDEYVRVLWSDVLAFPLEIERGRVDGTRRTRVKITVLDPDGVRPWLQLDGFRRRDLADFGD